MICCLLLVQSQLFRKLRLALCELLERHIRRSAVVLADIVVDHKLQGSVEDDVDDEYQGHIDHLHKGGIEPDEEQVDEEYGDEYSRHHHPCADELVVDMVLVREERAAVLADSVEGYSYHIEHRHHEGAECDDHELVASAVHLRVDAQVDHKVAQDIPEGEAACVSHEELVAFPLVAEHIVAPEHYHDAEGHKGEGSVDILLVIDQKCGKDGKRYAAEP